MTGNNPTPQPDIDDELREADKAAINKICDVYSMDEALAILDERITTHTEKAVRAARIDEVKGFYERGDHQFHYGMLNERGRDCISLDAIETRLDELQATNPVGGEG